LIDSFGAYLEKKINIGDKKLSICPTRLHLFAIMFIFLLFFILIFGAKEFAFIDKTVF